jgi:hypothetical protein
MEAGFTFLLSKVNVALLATVARAKRLPGRYVVQASYRFQGKRVLAEPLTVELNSGA